MRKVVDYVTIRKIVNESMRRVLNEEGENKEELDDYGEKIKPGGQGYGPNPELRNRQGYNEDGSKGEWFSRSVAVASAVFLVDEKRGMRYVLANRRGSGTPDYQGRWNLPCGYLDYNEDASEAAVREIREETGIRLSSGQMIEVSHSSSPYENRQNVCFFFMAVLNGNIEDYPFSTAEMEENEVSGIQWIPLEDIGKYKWAFWHNRLLVPAIKRLDAMLDGGDSKELVKNAYESLASIVSRNEYMRSVLGGPMEKLSRAMDMM